MAAKKVTTTQINNWDEELATQATVAAKSAAKNASAGNTFSTAGGILKFGGAPVPDNQIDAIILAGIASNAYYEGAWDPKSVSSPACFAFDPADDAEMAPHSASTKPQSDTCATCPKSQWGSAGGTSNAKACKNQRKLSLVPAGFIEGDKFKFSSAADLAQLAGGVLTVPPTSTRAYDAYVKTLAATRRRPPFAVATRITVVPGTPFTMTFDFLGDVPSALLGPLVERRAVAEAELRTPYSPNAPVVASAVKARKKF